MSDLVKPGKLYEVLPDGRWAFFFDSSTLRNFIECEAYFYEKHVRNIRPRGGGRKWKTEVGSWWSYNMELYYNSFRAGDLTITKVVEFAIHAWEETKMEDLKELYPKSYADFEGLNGAVLMATQYYENYINIDERSWTIVSVEEGAGRLREIKIGEDEQVVVYYIVKPDLFIIEDKKYLEAVDHKTKDYIQSNLIHSFKPHQQLMGYLVAGQQLADAQGMNITVDRCVINVAARNEPGPRCKQQARFMRIPIQYAPEQLHAWKLRVVEAARRMRYCFERNFWQWNTDACHKYTGCEFRPIHSQPQGAWGTIISANFDRIEPWVPYKTQEDEDN